MKIVFFGSSDFSVPPLEFCLKSRHEVVTVVTTPDRPKGRGLKIVPNPVEAVCEKNKIKVLAPKTLKDPLLEQQVSALGPDLFVVASYGKMIPASWLKIPRLVAMNIHPSLLPKYRGAAPITWQILDGEKFVGVSIAEVTPALDAGDIFQQIKIPLGNDETTESLTRKLSELSVNALREAVSSLEMGKLSRTKQEESKSSYARKLTKEDGWLDLKEEAGLLRRKILAFHPWPGAFVSLKGKPVRLLSASVVPAHSSSLPPGAIIEISQAGDLIVQAGRGALQFSRLQLPGKRPVSGRDFANGQRLRVGDVFEKLTVQ